MGLEEVLSHEFLDEEEARLPFPPTPTPTPPQTVPKLYERGSRLQDMIEICFVIACFTSPFISKRFAAME